LEIDRYALYWAGCHLWSIKKSLKFKRLCFARKLFAVRLHLSTNVLPIQWAVQSNSVKHMGLVHSMARPATRVAKRSKAKMILLQQYKRFDTLLSSWVAYKATLFFSSQQTQEKDFFRHLVTASSAYYMQQTAYQGIRQF
jgi:hypothetical protein